MSTELRTDTAPDSTTDGATSAPSPTNGMADRVDLDSNAPNDGSTPGGRSDPSTSTSWLARALALLAIFAVVTIVVLLRLAPSSDSGPRLTYTIRRGDLVVTVIEQGTLESSNNTEVKCKIRGKSTVTWVIEGGTLVEPGDQLVTMDTKRIEEAIGTHSTDAYVAKATFERTKADLARAEIAIIAYEEGTLVIEQNELDKRFDLAVSNHEAALTVLKHSEAMFRRGYVSKYERDSNRFAVEETELELKIRQNAIDVLENYTSKMEKVTLNGSLESLQSKFQADKAGLAMDEGRRDRAIEELQYCVVTAERSGLVIYPSAAAWKETPDIAEGALVRHDQVLLLMPDLSKMQIKVGIHEALVDRVKIGQSAKVTLPDYSLEGEVITVANVARPAGWWTGNMVKYDTVIKLPPTEGLRPGMSAEVEVVLAEHKDVIMVPVSAVVETEKQTLCWVKTGEDIERRVLKLGDSNDVFIVAKSGLAEGDEVVLNPLRYVEDAKGEAFQTFDEPVNDEPTVENVEINNTRSDQQRAANQTTAGESIDVN